MSDNIIHSNKKCSEFSEHFDPIQTFPKIGL
jgi:hypothetical protein